VRPYVSRYGFEDSIRDGATKPLHFEPRLVELHIDQKALEEAYRDLTAGLTDEDRDKLGKAAAKMAVLVKSPARISAICADIAQHFQGKVAPNGFGAQVVTFDRQSCILYKQEFDLHLPPEVSDIVMSVNSGEEEYAAYRRDRNAEEKLLDRLPLVVVRKRPTLTSFHPTPPGSPSLLQVSINSEEVHPVDIDFRHSRAIVKAIGERLRASLEEDRELQKKIESYP
jgi:hypothetical protein